RYSRASAPAQEVYAMTKLEEGAQAPAFTLPDQDGDPVSLDDFKGANVLVYFYPADDTPGCTKEACQVNGNLAGFQAARARARTSEAGQFSDDVPGVQAAGVPLSGIAPGKAASHQRFRNKYGLRFP